jgi:hypothetical protein
MIIRCWMPSPLVGEGEDGGKTRVRNPTSIFPPNKGGRIVTASWQETLTVADTYPNSMGKGHRGAKVMLPDGVVSQEIGVMVATPLIKPPPLEEANQSYENERQKKRSLRRSHR